MDTRFDAEEFPLEAVIGADFSEVLTFYPDGLDGDPQPWTGWSAEGQVRDVDDRSDGDPLASLDVELGSGGTVRLSLSKTVTAAQEPGAARYDVMITDPDGKRTRFVAGPFNFERAVTR